ncbi:MurR/RpiR family transcriptional regulator [Lactococcus lactis]
MLEKSAQEVAGEIGSSSAALVRFSRKLGYDGFSQFKQKLSASYAAHVDDEEYYKEVNDSESPTSIKNKLKVRVNHMVETTNSALLDDEIMEAVSSIDAAENIFVFGIGASSMVAQDIFKSLVELASKLSLFKMPIYLFPLFLFLIKNNLHWNFNEGRNKRSSGTRKRGEKYENPDYCNYFSGKFKLRTNG